MDYKNKVYSFLKLKGRICESEYAHYSIGLKAFEKIKKFKPKILDIGCGAGGLTGLWQEKLPEFIFEGIDISPKAIKLAEKLHPGIKFNVLSAERAGKIAMKYDAVSICEVIEHVENPEKILKNIHKILNKDGILYLTTQLEKDRKTLLGKIYGSRGIKPKEKINGHIQMFTDSRVKKLVNDSGFKIIEVYYNCHCLGQIADLIYTVNLRRKNGEVLSLTDNLQKKGGLKESLGFLCIGIVAFVRNFESLVFRKNIGLGIQIIARGK